jgi:uncharacterized membrane protein HdeD (DUF308 family)
MGADSAARADSPAKPRIAVSLAVRGALAIVLGLSSVGLSILGVLFPRVTANVLALLLGMYVLLDGLTTLIGGWRSSPALKPWLLAQGVLGLAAGIGIVSQRGAIAAPLFYLVVLWAIATGALGLVIATRIPAAGAAGLLKVAGLAAIVLGVVVLIGWPGAGLELFAWLLAAYALLVGIVRVMAAFRLPAG